MRRPPAYQHSRRLAHGRYSGHHAGIDGNEWPQNNKMQQSKLGQAMVLRC